MVCTHWVRYTCPLSSTLTTQQVFGVKCWQNEWGETEDAALQFLNEQEHCSCYVLGGTISYERHSLKKTCQIFILP